MRFSVGKPSLAVLGLVALFANQGHCVNTSYQRLPSSVISSGSGTISFQVTMHQDLSGDAHNHVLLLGVSSDSQERDEVVVVGDKLIARRYFGGCLLAVFIHPYSFQVGRPSRLELSWNGPSTRFQIDGQEAAEKLLLPTSDLGHVLPGVGVGSGAALSVDDFRSEATSSISVSEADRSLVNRTACPRLNDLLNEPAQATFRGIQLHHFPGTSALQKVQSYLALLPDDFADSIKHIVYVEDARSPQTGEGGSMHGRTKTIFLKGSVYDQPSVFFHEAGHAYDHKLHLALGVPEEKSEWVAIAGSHCYYKGADMDTFAREFQRTRVENGFLGGQGGQCPPEDLAEWVAEVYEAYLNKQPMTDLLEPSGRRYSSKNKQKLELLYRKGFFKTEIYQFVTKS